MPNGIDHDIRQNRDVFADFLKKLGRDETRKPFYSIFSNGDEPDEDQFAGNVRIILVSARFSKE